jgi:hypothetical protein
MIDERSLDETGWALFSDDRKLRYRLARALVPGALEIVDGVVVGLRGLDIESLARVVFLMLNPSTATAFKLDPTVLKCTKFARRWRAHVVEVVNLFALRSPYPEDLIKLMDDDTGRLAVRRGAGLDNDKEIINACAGASLVIAAWGNHGHLANRASIVRGMLQMAGVTLHHLGTTSNGSPLHPLARGKSSIPIEREPVVWT